MVLRFREAEERPEAIKALIDAIAYWQGEVSNFMAEKEEKREAGGFEG